MLCQVFFSIFSEKMRNIPIVLDFFEFVRRLFFPEFASCLIKPALALGIFDQVNYREDDKVDDNCCQGYDGIAEEG